MQLSRITLILTFVFCASVSQGQNSENPFARWERLKKQTESADRSAPAAAEASAKTKLEYFSPKADSVSGNAAAPVVRKERLKVSGSTTADRNPFDILTVSDKSKTAEASVSTPAADAGNEATAGRGPVTFARFAAKHDVGGVQQTSAEFFTEVAEGDTEENPFAELLDGDGTEKTSRPDTADTPPAAKTATVAASEDLVQLPDLFQGPQTPSVTVQWVYHDEFSVGTECRCDLVVENSGRSPVRNVVAEAVLPKGLRVIAAAPEPAAAGGSARWMFAELKPGRKEKIALTVVPLQRGDLRMNAFVQLTGASAGQVSVTEPMVAISLEGPKTVALGQQVGYTVLITNPGTGRAKNVAIQAAVPDGLEHRQGKLLTIDVGTLNPGEQRRARLSLTGTKGGDQNLAVRVIADGGLSDETAQVVSVAEARLNIGLRGPAVRKTGQLSDYELIVVNEGKVDSDNVRTKYKVPAGFEFVRADAGGKYNPEERTIEWFVGNLGPNRVRQFRVTLKPVASGVSSHQVGVISENGKTTTAEHSTTVEGSARLALNVTTKKAQVQAGEETAFELRISNSGDSAAENVGLSCELPPGLALVDIAGPSEYIADNGVVIFRSLPKVETGKDAVFVIRVRCRRAGSHKIRARVASESVNEPVIGEAVATGRE